MRFQSLQVYGVLALVVMMCGATSCRKGASSSSGPPQAEVELYLVDTSSEGMSDEELDEEVEYIADWAKKAIYPEEFAEFLMEAPTWSNKDLGWTRSLLRSSATVNAIGDTMKDTVTIRISGSLDEDTAIELANSLAAYLVEEMVDLRAYRLRNKLYELSEALSEVMGEQKEALLYLNRKARELGYSAEFLLELDEIEAHPSVLNYRVQLDVLKELMVQMKLKEVRGEEDEDFQQAVEKQEELLEEAVKKLAESDVREALNESSRRKAENLLNLEIVGLRDVKRDYDVLVEVSQRLWIMESLMPFEDVAISPMLVQRHGAELVE